MNKEQSSVRLRGLLAQTLPDRIAKALVDHLFDLRKEVATGSNSRSAGGKFVESYVQALQFLSHKPIDAQPPVDQYLRNLDSAGSNLDPGLRICASRIARAVYTLRNKRSIAHVGEVDPNKIDLAMMLHGCQWLLSELVRSLNGLSMEEANRHVQAIQAPIGGLVEDFGGVRIVLEDVPLRDEILILLHSCYPAPIERRDLEASLQRRSTKYVRSTLRELWNTKFVHEVRSSKYVEYSLTHRGLTEASRVVDQMVGETPLC